MSAHEEVIAKDDVLALDAVIANEAVPLLTPVTLLYIKNDDDREADAQELETAAIALLAILADIDDDATVARGTDPLTDIKFKSNWAEALYVVKDPLSTIGIKSSVVISDIWFSSLILTFDIFQNPLYKY